MLLDVGCREPCTGAGPAARTPPDGAQSLRPVAARRGLLPGLVAALPGLLLTTLAPLAGALVPLGPQASPGPGGAPSDANLDEITVVAPEPRYVAPTRRDRIGRIWAPVYINEQGPFRMVLDTGANHSAINAEVAAQLSIVPDATQSVTLRGVTGSRVVPSILIDSLVLGDLELRLKRLPIVTDPLGGAQGVLGTDGLGDKRIVIDFRHDRITVFRSHNERAPAGFVTIPVTLTNGLLLVAEVRIGRVRAKAIIDTGGQVSLANAALENALRQRTAPEDVASDAITGATLDVEFGDRLPIPGLQIGDLKINGARITAGDMQIFTHWHLTDEPAILIGMDVLGLVDTLIIDYRRREIQVLTREARSGFPQS